MAALRNQLRGLLANFAAHEGGNIAILFAVFVGIGTIAGAFAVDEGAVYLQRRTVQSAVDLASIAAARDPQHAYQIVKANLVNAGVLDASVPDSTLASATAPIRLSVETGGYAANPGLAVAQRFTAGASAINAVHVTFSTPGELYFAQRWGKAPEITTLATGSATPSVAFSVGSTLLNFSDGLPNALLNALLGSNVSLSAVSYNGLLSTKISLFGFLDALAQELGITVGTYQDVLDATADQGVIAKAIADVTTGADMTAAVTLSHALGHNGKVPIGKLFNLGNAAGLAIGTGSTSGYFASLSALQMLAATGAISDGTHQVSLNLAANIPGLSSLVMTVAVGEPPQFAAWFALGPSGTIVETGQIRIRFVATIGGGLVLLNAAVRVPLYLEIAYAEAGVRSATCPAAGASTGTAVIATQPGVARLILGDVGDPAFGNFGATPTISPATLVNLAPLLTVTGSASASIGQTTPTPLSFSASDITGGVMHRAITTTFTQSLMTSLLGSLNLHVGLGLGLGLPSIGGVTSTLGALLAPLGPVIDAAISSTLGALGITLGDADVRVYGVNCSRAVLVQ